MKIVIKFNKHCKKPEDIKRLMELENISQHIIDIINDPTLKGCRIVNYKNETIFTILFK